MYRKGQKIKMTRDCSSGGFKRGDVFTLTRDHEWRAVFVDNDGDYRSRDCGFELVPAITITTGKFYRTASGAVTGRVTKGDTGFEAVVDGRVRIFDKAGGHVHGDDDLDIVEAWVPKVGERVRFTDECSGKCWFFGPDTKFKSGVVTVDNHNREYYRFRVDTGDGIAFINIQHIEPLPVAPLPVAAPQPAALKIEAGRYYKTRDGRKVGPMEIDDWGDGQPWTDGFQWFCNDGNWSNSEAESSNDLIAEWQDTPSAPVAAQVDTIAEEYGPVITASEPKFKVGDRVKAVKGTAILKVGEIYTVERVDGYRVYVGVDDYGTLDYGQDYFDLVPAQQQEPDATLHIKFTSDFSELDAAILVRKKKLKKLIKLARKAGIELREAA